MAPIVMLNKKKGYAKAHTQPSEGMMSLSQEKSSFAATALTNGWGSGAPLLGLLQSVMATPPPAADPGSSGAPALPAAADAKEPE